MTDSEQPVEVVEEFEELTETESGEGWFLFSALLALLAGVFNFVEGLVALTSNVYKAHLTNFGVVVFGLTGWGWIHLVFGLALIAVGVGLLMNMDWAIPAAIAVAAATAVIQMMYIFSAPLWSFVVIALCVGVIYGLTVKWRSV